MINLTNMVHRLATRMWMMVGRGDITQVNDDHKTQFMQIRLGDPEVHDTLPRVGEYGLSSNPPAGGHAVVLFVGGDRSMGIVVGTGHNQYRITGLGSGEVVLYDNAGQTVELRKDRIKINSPNLIEVISAMEIDLKAPTIKLSAG